MLTWLYVPGDRPDRFAKAVCSGADVVIIDLEDAVTPARKAYARQAVARFLATVPDTPCQVRVAGLADLSAVVGLPGLDGLWLPKIGDPRQVREYARRAPGVRLHPLIETARGVERAYDIASVPGVAGVALGEADLGSDLGVVDESGFAWARGRLVVAARAAGLPAPAMSVWTDLEDQAGLAVSCAAGRALGMMGRAAIHPRQIPVIMEAFRPSAAAVERARELLAVVAAATGAGSGTAVLPDGRFADRAMAGSARRTIALAQRYGTRSSGCPPTAE